MSKDASYPGQKVKNSAAPSGARSADCKGKRKRNFGGEEKPSTLATALEKAKLLVLHPNHMNNLMCNLIPPKAVARHV